MGYWDVLDPYWEKIDIYSGPSAFLSDYRATPEVARTLFAAQWCDAEVGNGGFAQFFGNSTGVLAPEAADAFGRIGLHDIADVVLQAMSLFGVPYPRDEQDRAAKLSELCKTDDPFRELDQRFYAACYVDPAVYDGSKRLHDALDRYAQKGE
jgi:hypothetical protein